MAPARKRKTLMAAPKWTKEDKIAYNWCINNGIKIGPWACSSDRDNYYWWIDVNVNGKKVRSPYKYNGKQVMDKIFELYRFYYDKNKV
tara:strand:+ start:131 stop:394 length:264 start_codon:yes stop_codon:yes gene_type:complete